MNLSNLIIGVCSLLLLMVGADKFLNFMEPPCSLMENISTTTWQALGVIQLAGGILLWMPKLRRSIASFFIVFMLFFTIMHLKENTYDIGGSVFMVFLFGIIAWNPSFLSGKK